MTSNPFAVKNPEDLSAKEIADNFVDLFTDFQKIQNRENCFLHGARGTGKSMMMRGLETAVMLELKHSSITDLPHIGVHVPLRHLDFRSPELDHPRRSIASAIIEHLLVLYIASRLSNSLMHLDLRDQDNATRTMAITFARLFKDCGGEDLGPPVDLALADNQLRWIAEMCDAKSRELRVSCSKIAFSPDNHLNYNGALCSFDDFLVPFLAAVTGALSIPKVPVFLMLDDADNLPVIGQRILNSWVSKRIVTKICLKITTQLGYATFRTMDGRLIESPHDFTEIDIASVYSNRDSSFSKRLREIAVKRLSLANIKVTPEQFFPRDEKQHEEIQKIADEIRTESIARLNDSTIERRGAARPSDDVVRNAIPRYMATLAGNAKSSHTYSYAGFDSLVDLSSGVIRWFLDPAGRMYDEVAAEQIPVRCIPTGIQDKVISAIATEFMAPLLRSESVDAQEPDHALSGGSLHAFGHDGLIRQQLHNLIEGLGILFRGRLLDEKSSERRIFSIALTGEVSPELSDVLNYGIRRGYLQRSTNASKSALGSRVPRYILARKLGPHFKIDVSGYAAHLSVTAKVLEIALTSPKNFVAARLRNTSITGQMELGYVAEIEGDE